MSIAGRRVAAARQGPSFYRLTWRERLLTLVTWVMIGLVAGLVWTQAFPALDGFVYDETLALAGKPVFDARKVAVVGLDRWSLDDPMLEGTPRVLMSPIWAKTIDALTGAGADTILFDIIFQFNAGNNDAVKPGYDDTFKAALNAHRRQLVIARSFLAKTADPYHYAILGEDEDPLAGDSESEGYAEVSADDDGIYRRFTSNYTFEDGSTGETLVHRVMNKLGKPMPEEGFMLPSGPLETMPSYALVDVLRCAEDPAALRRAFAGKVVLIGTTAPDEDRKTGPDRLMPRPPAIDRVAQPGCHLDQIGPSAPGQPHLPGVYLHAAALEALLTDHYAERAPRWIGVAAAAGLAGLGVAAGFGLPALVAIAAVAVLLGLAAVFSGVLLLSGLWMPVSVAASTAIGGAVSAGSLRLFTEERLRKHVQRAFGFYVAPELVEQLIEDEALMHLGGTSREVTVMFADLSGFTSLSESVPADVLMRVTNGYLQILADAVEDAEGTVDKFIGDALMALWGALLTQPDQEMRAVGAAVDLVTKVNARFEADRARGDPALRIKVGINTGPAVVGNVGSVQRRSFTAVGETVNIAARLESVPNEYGCRIVISESTARKVAGSFVLCELDWIRLKGREDALPVFEVLGRDDGSAEALRDYAAGFGAALAFYRAGHFREAAARWATLTYPFAEPDRSPPNAVMAARAALYAKAPPPADWGAVWVLLIK